MTADCLVNVSDLERLLRDDTVVFDCRFSLLDLTAGANAYSAGHIDGAFRLDLEKDLAGAKAAHGGRHPLPAAHEFARRMRECGVRRDSLVVLYDDNRLAGAARAWWLLKYFGHRRVRLLDGGYAAWRDAQAAVSTEAAVAVAAGDFVARPAPGMLVDYEEVRRRSADGTVALIDSREPPRFRGEEEPLDPVAGRIPGAVNFCWLEVTDEAGRVRPPVAQAERWRKLQTAESPIVYCGSGVTACVNLLSLELAGMRGAKLYAGSWSDWCSYSDSPIETGPGET